MKVQFSSFSRVLSQTRKLTQISKGPHTTGPQVDHRNFVSQAEGLSEGDQFCSFLTKLEPSHHCSWEAGGWSPTPSGPLSHSLMGSRHLPPARVMCILLFEESAPTLFQSGESLSASSSNLQIPPASPSRMIPSGIPCFWKTYLSFKLPKGSFHIYELQTHLKQGTGHKDQAVYLEEGKKYRKC